MGLFKLAFYAAAGYGTYEILRRTGLLQKTGAWLSEQVPDDFKDQAREYVDNAKQQVGELGDQVRQRAQQYGDRAQQYVGQATDALRQGNAQPATAGASTSGGNGNGNGSSNAPGHQTISGPGRGTQQSVDEVDGGHVSHTVGRGVVR